jgi:phage I-like protein
MSAKKLPFVVKLNESGSITRDYEIARVCTITDPRYGKVPITKETLIKFIENFDKNARGIDIMIDFEHKVDGGAAGWIKKLYLGEDGVTLRSQIDWTPKGEAALQNKEYAYFSPDFEFNYEDNETGEKFGPVLKGAALTNRPVIKRMEPAVALSEGETMKTDLEKAQDEVKRLTDELAKVNADHVKLSEQVAADQKKLADLGMSPEDMKKLIDELQAKIQELEASNAQAAADKQMAEKKTQFQKLLSEGKAVPAQEEAFLAGDTVKFAELAGNVNLSAKGHGGGGPAHVDDPDAKIMELAEKKMGENKSLSLSEAISQVRSENQDLWKSRK